MSCCHYYEFTEQGDRVFSVDIAAIKFGPGSLQEVGSDAVELGLKRVGIFTDPVLADFPYLDTVQTALRQANVDFETYTEVHIEPTDQSFQHASQFATEGKFDGFISLGGGSVIDTCKAANLYSTHPAEFETYVNAPLGDGKPVPGRLKPHIACPTTSGTGSECTGIAVFDYLKLKVKTGIASRALRPTKAVIDPTSTYTLPANVVAASGFDVLSHALESYTAIPYTQRSKPASPALRPMSQGANPYSDVGCEKALDLTGRYLVRATQNSDDHEARDNMMFAATLAGIAFGNSGVHIPHGMAYSVAGLVKDYQPQGYPDDEPICPHGISVIVNAPSAFRFTAEACPDRHRRGAELLGSDHLDVPDSDTGEVLAQRLIEMMHTTAMPNGVGGVGYDNTDISDLVEGAYAQQRLLQQSPREVSKESLAHMYSGAMNYW
ncbi:MAG: hydroxyacid-oxoacid transhydrogenase [Arenicellales bacterium]|nr:hydroxyacid-oxoacid transhydrogenase [Arenicellales bacterium]